MLDKLKIDVVYIKKHPRDETNYKFNNDVITKELYKEFPLELLLIKFKKNSIKYGLTYNSTSAFNLENKIFDELILLE